MTFQSVRLFIHATIKVQDISGPPLLVCSILSVVTDILNFVPRPICILVTVAGSERV